MVFVVFGFLLQPLPKKWFSWQITFYNGIESETFHVKNFPTGRRAVLTVVNHLETNQYSFGKKVLHRLFVKFPVFIDRLILNGPNFLCEPHFYLTETVLYVFLTSVR